jgi:type I restriction enzyme S subunit
VSGENNNIPEGFKMTEVGVLPEEWETITLESVAYFTSKPRELDVSNCEAIPFIPMEAISSDGSGHFRYHVKPGKEILSGVYCERGDLLLAKITPCLENGKQCLLSLDELPSPFAYTTTEVYPLKIDENVADIRFLFLLSSLSTCSP